jgi:hypothetical protein
MNGTTAGYDSVAPAVLEYYRKYFKQNGLELDVAQVIQDPGISGGTAVIFFFENTPVMLAVRDAAQSVSPDIGIFLDMVQRPDPDREAAQKLRDCIRYFVKGNE